jgi:HAE1 family hydrophobic/amphiphilic exporter-1
MIMVLSISKARHATKGRRLTEDPAHCHRFGAKVARAARSTGPQSLEAAVTAARFRPIIMTSFAFILGVVPLVMATGAGANARASPGLSVMTGMLASTCLAVLFVPSFFVVPRRFEEWRRPVPARNTV